MHVKYQRTTDAALNRHKLAPKLRRSYKNYALLNLNNKVEEMLNVRFTYCPMVIANTPKALQLDKTDR